MSLIEENEEFKIKNGAKSRDLLKRNINSYLDLFSSRQLLYIHHTLQQIRSYQGITKLNLGLLVSTSLEFNSMLCGYRRIKKNRKNELVKIVDEEDIGIEVFDI